MKKSLAFAGLIAACMSTAAFANDDKVKYYFDKADTNKDGSISKAEHTALGDTMFTEADTNKDGMISMDEAKAQKAKEKSEMYGRNHAKHGGDAVEKRGSTMNSTNDPSQTEDTSSMKERENR